MAEDPQPQTLQQRIAMLNAAQVGRAPGEPVFQRVKPSLPAKRPDLASRQSVNNPPAATTVSLSVHHNQPNGTPTNGTRPPPPKVKAVPPPLPQRRPSESPALPPRRPSEQAERRGSQESAVSITSSISSLALGNSGEGSVSKVRDTTNRIKAPAWDPTNLPKLPLGQHERHASIPSLSSKEPKSGNTINGSHQAKPALPPRLPPRKSSNVEENSGTNGARKSALSFGMNKEVSPPPVPSMRSQSVGPEVIPSGATTKPPPVPLGSRPDLSKLQATKPKLNGQPAASSQSPCMICRDFSGPDDHAARFPRQSLPQHHAIPWLAQQLTAPFPSLTDKARAIFTWLHYNILYDVESFFAKCIRPSTPASTLASGLAVCEGYAGLYTTLATHAGLESVVISGHGKGYGYHPLAPGQPLPPLEAGHAWNVVKIDNGEWKLIDPCWGAGHVQGHGMPYQQKFDPTHFTMTNEEFGIKHFPMDRTQLYLPGGATMTWEQYIVINPANWPNLVEPPTVFSNALEEHGVGARSLLPLAKKVNVYGNDIVRFQFGHPCPHFTLERHVRRGPPYVYVLSIHGIDGRKDDFIPFEHVRGQTPGGGGDLWYTDVESRMLGAPGQSITVFAVTSFSDKTGEACRGLTVREFKDLKGRTNMGFQGVLAWELA